MNGYTKSEIIKGRIKFITMSILGIILFLIPIPVVQDGQNKQHYLWHFFCKLFKRSVRNIMPILIVLIITISGVLTLLCSTIYKHKLNHKA